MHGACFKGEACEFSHNWADPSSNVCTFYQKGICSYGSHCRYDHVKLSRSEGATLLESTSTAGCDFTYNYGVASHEQSPSSIKYDDLSESFQPSILPLADAMRQLPGQYVSLRVEAGQRLKNPSFRDPAEEPICAAAAAGRCAHGDSCPHLHGDSCPICGKRCLHPFRPTEREEHRKQCERNKIRLEALRYSQEIECSVCLERVLSKPTVAERKFGLLSSCDHPFCVSCIRDWRSSAHVPGMDVDTVVRACPVCRVVSHFVIPSVIWYSSPEEKEEIVNGYKGKLSTIDCRYFNFGNGSCPFGTSCFYKHAYQDGTIEETKLRHLADADGGTVIAKNIRLSDFLGNLNLRG